MDLTDIVLKHGEMFKTSGESGKTVTVDCDLAPDRKFQLVCFLHEVSPCLLYSVLVKLVLGYDLKMFRKLIRS